MGEKANRTANNNSVEPQEEFLEEEEETLFGEEIEADEYDLVEGEKEEVKKEEAPKDEKQPEEEFELQEKRAPHVPKEKPQMAIPTSMGGELKLEDIPITLTVELAELQITAQKLLELSPGNMLEIGDMTSHALLTVNGKIVGKGEIIRIGNALGIRVLEIG